MRLAERQGLLKGRISQVGSLGLRVLMMLDRQEIAEVWWRDFRARIGAAHPERIKDLFPEFYPEGDAEETGQQATEDGTRDYNRLDESAIKWTVPASEQERAELDAFLAEALSRTTTHTATATELEEGGWM